MIGLSRPCCCPTMSINDVTVTEGNSGTTNAVLTVSLDKDYCEPITVEYETVDDTATGGSDYTTTSGTLTFAAGETTKKITVEVIGDTDCEDDETFTVELSNPLPACVTFFDLSGSANVGVVTIVDDEECSDCECPDGNFLPATVTLDISGMLDRPFGCLNCNENADGSYEFDFETCDSNRSNVYIICVSVQAAIAISFVMDTPNPGDCTVTVQINDGSITSWSKVVNSFDCLQTPISVTSGDLTSNGVLCDASAATLTIS